MQPVDSGGDGVDIAAETYVMADDCLQTSAFLDNANDCTTVPATADFADEFPAADDDDGGGGVGGNAVRGGGRIFGSSGELEAITHEPVWTPDVVQRVATLVPLMVATLLGNVIIVVVLTCSKHRKVNSRVNIFIINLALGDLTVLCCTMTTEVGFRFIFIFCTPLY